MLNQTALLIVGMHRSATSAWAGVFSAVGLQLPKRLLPANEFNKKGYFEPDEVVRAHDAYFAEIGRTWSSVHPIREDELHNQRSDALVQKLCDVIVEDFEPGSPWIIKDPRLCLLMPVWHRVLRQLRAEPRVVLPMRAPAQVARSLASRDGMSVDHGYFLWLRHVLDAERHTRDVRRAFVTADTLTDDWRTSILALEDLVGIDLKPRIEAAGEVADAFLEPQMIHRGAVETDGEGEAPHIRRWAEEVHEAVLGIGLKGAVPAVSRRLDEIRVEFDAYARAVGAVAGDLERALQARIRHYFDERALRLRAEAQVQSARKEATQAEAQRKELEAARAQLEQQVAAERQASGERVADLERQLDAERLVGGERTKALEERLSSERAAAQQRATELEARLAAERNSAAETAQKLGSELATERSAALSLARQVQELAGEMERFVRQHDAAVAEHTKLKSLYAAEALVRESLQSDFARLMDKHDATLASNTMLEEEIARLSFEETRLSEQVIALGTVRARAEALATSLKASLDEHTDVDGAARAEMEAEVSNLRSMLEGQAEVLTRSRQRIAALTETTRQSLQLAETFARDASQLARNPLRAWLGKATGKADPDRFLKAVTTLDSLAGQLAEKAEEIVLEAAPKPTARPQQRVSRVDSTQIAAPRRLVYVSHDAHPHGAQMLSLAIIKALREHLGLEVEVVLLGEGPLLPQFEALAAVHVLRNPADGATLAEDLYARGFRGAIANTVVTGHFAASLKGAGFRVVNLIHELPGVIRTGQFESRARAIADNADRVVFAAPLVRDSFVEFARLRPKQAVIRPQGLYKESITGDPIALRALRTGLRERLDLAASTKIVINVGFADRRKGVDLFCEVAKRIISERNDVAFVWVGGLHVELEKSLLLLAEDEQLDGRLKFMRLVDLAEVGAVYGGADLFLLTSREDPFPSVVLEALDAGLPVVAFDGVTGTNEVIGSSGGTLVPAFDVEAMTKATLSLLDRPDSRAAFRTKARAVLSDRFDFRRYALDLVALADPQYRRVSVIVPNHGNRDELEARVRRIASQSYPPYEVIITGDSSTWLDSKLLENVPGVRFATVEGTAPSLVSQWRKGIELARGDYVWIAGADDLASPQFLETLLKGFETSGVVMSYCQSRRVDGKGRVIASDWLEDVADISKDRWASSYVVDGTDEIAKSLAIRNTIRYAGAVLVERDALVAALDAIGPAWEDFSVTGDWLLWMAVLKAGKVAYTRDALVDHVEKDSVVGAAKDARKPQVREIVRAQAHAQAFASIGREMQKRAGDFAWQAQRDEVSASKPPITPVQHKPLQNEAETRIPIPQLHASEAAPVGVAVATAVGTFARAHADTLNVPSAIDGRDPFFRKTQGAQNHNEQVQAYFDEGRRSAVQLRELLAKPATQRHLEKPRPTLLEFAPSYGWLTRHLPSVFPDCEVLAASQDGEAATFIKTQLGVPALNASLKPDEFQFGRQFDVILAMSFFTQLDDATWGVWLRALFSQLVPGGALIFSAHGVVSRKQLGNPTLNERGFWFGAGAAIVTPGYVLRQIYEQAPGSLSHFQEGGWRGHEDVYVLAK